MTAGAEAREGDHALAAALAAGAGELLVALRADPPADRSLRDAGDAAAHGYLVARLAAERPGDVVFSEEAADPRARLDAERVWIVDPLDGTKEFGDGARTDWAVHVALWERGALVAGAVALPALGEVHATGAGAVPPRREALADGAPVRFVVSRSRPPRWAVGAAAAMGAELVQLGSAGRKAAAVWRGEGEAYLHSGGLFEWDAAAPVAVALAAGLHVSRVDGTPVEFNRADPYLPDLLVCVPELREALLAWVAEHGGDEVGNVAPVDTVGKDSTEVTRA